MVPLKLEGSETPFGPSQKLSSFLDQHVVEVQELIK